MTVRRKHKKKPVFFNSPFAIAIMFVVSFFAVGNIIDFYPKKSVHEQLLAEEKEQYEALAEERNMLKEKVAYVESERGKEAYVREVYDVVREGEELIIFPEEDQEIYKEATTTVKTKKTFLDYIFFWR